MEVSSTVSIVLTVMLVVIPIWAWQKLNSLWLRPKRLERLLRAQGLQGDPYKLSVDNPKHFYMLKMQEEARSKSIGLSNEVAPRVISPIHLTVNKYGKNSFLWDGSTPKVIITDPEQIKEVFNKMQDFPKPQLSSIAKLLATGLPYYEGEKWAKHRKIINPAFHLEKLKDMLPAFLQSCCDMISKWDGMLSSDGTCEIDVFPFLQILTRDVISRTAFGSSYEEGTKIFEHLKELGYHLMNRHTSRWCERGCDAKGGRRRRDSDWRRWDGRWHRGFQVHCDRGGVRSRGGRRERRDFRFTSDLLTFFPSC